MLPVKLHKLGTVNNKVLTKVVCISKYDGKRVYSKHQERKTLETPAGHTEEGKI